MIKKAFILLKINLMTTLNINQKNKKVFAPLFFLGFGIVLFIAFFQYSLMFANYLKTYDLTMLIFPAFSIMGMIMMLMMSTYKSRGALFDFKDSDLLFSMPIPESSILAQKIINMMMFNYIITFLTLIPTAIVYNMIEKTPNIYWFFVFLIFIFMPFIPTLISAVFGYIIGYISSKAKRKSFVETISSFIILLIFLIISTKLDEVTSYLFNHSDNIDNLIKNTFYPLYWIEDALCNGNWLSMLLLIVVNMVSFSIFLFAFNKLFSKINKQMKEKFANKNYEMTELKTNNKIKAMFNKEFTLYTQSSVYMLNTCFGAVSMLMFAISSFFYDTSILTNTILKYSGISISNYQLLTIICGVMASLSCTTPASVSMEGKSLWICRSMPISEMKIFFSKMLVDLTVILPANILAMILLSITFRLTLSESFILFCLILIVGISMTQFGILLNIKYPKLEFKSETEAVKGSLSASLAVYIPIAIAFLLGLLYMVIASFVKFKTYLFSLVILFVIIAIILFICLKTYGVKKFRELYC